MVPAAAIDATLLQKLEVFSKQQVILRMYQAKIKMAAANETYRRKTFLDDPNDSSLPEVENSDSKLSKEE